MTGDYARTVAETVMTCVEAATAQGHGFPVADVADIIRGHSDTLTRRETAREIADWIHTDYDPSAPFSSGAAQLIEIQCLRISRGTDEKTMARTLPERQQELRQAK